MKRIVAIIIMLVLFINGCKINNIPETSTTLNTNYEMIPNPMFSYPEYKTTATTVETTSNMVSTHKATTHHYTANKKHELNVQCKELLGLINDYRTENHINNLIIEPSLCDAACIRAKEASIKWSHTRPDGSQVDSILNKNRIVWKIVGENLAKYDGIVDSENIIKSWKSSESHRKNLINPKFNKCGIASCSENNVTYIALILTD